MLAHKDRITDAEIKAELKRLQSTIKTIKCCQEVDEQYSHMTCGECGEKGMFAKHDYATEKCKTNADLIQYGEKKEVVYTVRCVVCGEVYRLCQNCGEMVGEKRTGYNDELCDTCETEEESRKPEPVMEVKLTAFGPYVEIGAHERKRVV